MKGHIRIPHDWILAHRGDGRVLGLVTLLEHYRFTGASVSVRQLASDCHMDKSTVSRIAQKWQNHVLEAENERMAASETVVRQEWDKISPQVAVTADDSESGETVVRHNTDKGETPFYIPKEQEQEQTKEIDPDAERLTLLFADTLNSAAEEHGISRRKQARPPKAWFTEMDRLLRLDGIAPEVVESVMLWAITESDFWGTGSGQGVLQSVPKLRKHWDLIASQRAEAQPRGRFDVAKRVLAASEGGKRGHRREGPALRVLAGQLDGVRQRGQ